MIAYSCILDSRVLIHFVIPIRFICIRFHRLVYIVIHLYMSALAFSNMIQNSQGFHCQHSPKRQRHSLDFVATTVHFGSAHCSVHSRCIIFSTIRRRLSAMHLKLPNINFKIFSLFNCQCSASRVIIVSPSCSMCIAYCKFRQWVSADPVLSLKNVMVLLNPVTFGIVRLFLSC